MFAEGPGGEGEVGHVPGEVEPAVAAVVVSPHLVENLFCCNGIGQWTVTDPLSVFDGEVTSERWEQPQLAGWRGWAYRGGVRGVAIALCGDPA